MGHTLVLRRFLLTLAFLVLSLVSAQAQGGFDITAVARPGDPVRAPATLVSASEPRLSDTGDVLFRGDGGLLLTSPEGLIVVAAPGDVTPDGRLIRAIGDASVNARGEVAFVASLLPSGFVLFLFSKGTITAIAQSSDPPALPIDFPLRSPSLNARGQLAFIDGGRILLFEAGVVTELVRIDHPALVQPNLRLWFSYVRLNEAGDLAFSTVTQGAGGGARGAGVYTMVGGDVRVIAVPGTVTPDGGRFMYVGGDGGPSLNARGDVAFSAYVDPLSPGIFMSSDADDTLTQIARVGDVVAENTLTDIGRPTIDAQGQIAFGATASGPGTSPQGAIFLFSGGVVRPLVGAGDPTAEGNTLASAASPWFNASGQLAFVEFLPPSGLTRARVYRLTDEGISRVAGDGDVIPATPRVVSASTTSVRSMGQPVFEASIFPGGTGIFDIDGVLRARIGDEAPGGGFITAISEVASNEHGAVAFTASLLPTGAGLFVSREGRLIEVVRAGAPAPDGGTFTTPSAPSVNASGHVAFTASVLAGRSGVFLAADEAIAPVVRVGDPAPDGNPFTQVMGASLNDAGQVAFLGAVSGGTRLFVTSGQDLTEVARTGDPAPQGGTFSSFFDPQLNASGQVAFRAAIQLGPSGFFLFVPDQGIRSVVRSGDLAPGGDTFIVLPNAPSLGAAGRVAFTSMLSSTAGPPFRSGAFLFEDGNFEVIAQPGDPAPGGDTFTSVADPKLSANGQILFTGATASTSTDMGGVFVPTGVFLASRPASQPQVHIDIRPAGAANRINPASDRSVPVAILSDDAFDATTVAADTVRFGSTGTEAAPTQVAVLDVDGDSDVDLVVRFRITDTGIQCGQTSALLTGRTSDGRTFAASDAIQTRPVPMT